MPPIHPLAPSPLQSPSTAGPIPGSLGLVAAWAKALGTADIARLASLCATNAVLDHPSCPEAVGRERIHDCSCEAAHACRSAGCDGGCTTGRVVQQGSTARSRGRTRRA